VITIDSNSPVHKLVQANMSRTLGWVVLIVALGAFAAITLLGVRRRRATGLTAPPTGVTLLTLGAAAVGGIALVLICNENRGNGLAFFGGTPWVVPFVALVLLFYTWMLTRTRLGRYIYAIGSNPEAARRAGISVNRIKTIAFVLCSVTAGIAGLIYESNQGSMATDINGGQLVLYGVAAAVIGGTSLFGGRGRIIDAIIGGAVVEVINNGFSDLFNGNNNSAIQLIAIGLALALAAAVDALSRRRAGASGLG
jgi:D-xylose transport system permease protein